MTAGCAVAAFVVIVDLLPGITSWSLYRTDRETVVAVAMGVLLAVIAGAALGAAAALIATLVLMLSGARAHWVPRIVTAVSLVTASFWGLALVWGLLVWIETVFGFSMLHFDELCVCVVVVSLAAAALLYFRNLRQQATAELERAFTGKTTRRVVLGMTAGALATVASASPPLMLQPPPIRRKAAGRNILLVTFDALSADHMASYGYARQTTPTIDALSRNSTLFENFFASSTFTTPCVASILSGQYPSATRMIHLTDRFRGPAANQTLMRVLRDHGYATGGSFGNYWAHPGRMALGDQFDELPPPPDVSAVLPSVVSRQAYADVWVEWLSYLEYMPSNIRLLSPKLFAPALAPFGPEASFHQADNILERLPKPFFLWVHVLAPHYPYVPVPPYLHHFLKGDRMLSRFEYFSISGLFGGPYPPQLQPLVDLARLRYDEWLMEADAAFGAFLQRNAGWIDDATVIVSSDHGESFDANFWSHGGGSQLRPIIHVPLAIRTAGQSTPRRVHTVADQTALAPTILDLASVPIPAWMNKQSLLQTAQSIPDQDSGGLAFTQYLEQNSAFGQLRQGTIGVIDGTYQYVLDIATKKGRLYRLSEANLQAHDLAEAMPAKAQELRRKIFAKFPEFAGASS